MLLPVDQYERNDVEYLENTNFSSLLDIGDKFRDAWIFINLNEFMTACNDQEINLELYWITYINVPL